MIIPVILAGGSGTRLWPLSREQSPKQLMNLIGNHTMLQNTVLRMTDYSKVHDPIILCNESHRFMVAEQLRQLNIKPSAIILEPIGRNTAPAVAIASLKGLSLGEDPILVILPADHFIENVSLFHDALKTGGHFARKDYLITFGIVPDAPETGYGYIRKGNVLPDGDANNAGVNSEAFAIDAFVEKPDLKTAEKYLNSGDYCWNSGMFMFKASQVLNELKAYAPEIVTACETAFEKGKDDLGFFRLDLESFSACPANSIDYAVMEKTDKGAMVPFSAGWNDLGSWEALWRVGNKDKNKNVIYGDILYHDVKNSYLHATGRMLAAVGLKDHIVVETADAVLISPRDSVQNVKQLVNQLKAGKRKEAVSHKNDYRPWGSIIAIDSADRFQVKRLTIKPGAKTSLQKHFNRAEHWIVLNGTALVTKGDEQFALKADQSTFIPVGITHRLENPGRIPLDLIEVRSGKFLGENDIVRLEDDYGR